MEERIFKSDFIGRIESISIPGRRTAWEKA